MVMPGAKPSLRLASFAASKCEGACGEEKKGKEKKGEDISRPPSPLLRCTGRKKKIRLLAPAHTILYRAALYEGIDRGKRGKRKKEKKGGEGDHGGQKVSLGLRQPKGKKKKERKARKHPHRFVPRLPFPKKREKGRIDLILTIARQMDRP